MTAVYEMAKKYYPTLWNAQRIRALYEAGKLTEEEYEKIVGERAEEKLASERTDKE